MATKLAVKRSPAEKQELMLKLKALRDKGSTIQQACDRLGVSTATYNFWLKDAKKKGAKKSAVPVAASPAPVTETPAAQPQPTISIGNTDMLFIGLGYRADVITALAHLEKIITAR
jgi:orotate phosphoribosyltransferase-like protein